jgi:hypothetical protein
VTASEQRARLRGLWSVEAIVDAADRALYAAKRAGRDCSLLVTEPPSADRRGPEAIRLAQALAVSAAHVRACPRATYATWRPLPA